uniref:receptor kinase-like protein Xa21 n=1 Tax=Erigeron canadensis TaxID=72917 RepID=UPI001CB8FE28|nr:receptor kinase-like protein Xa21 [Erigeron canadensis]
MNKLLLLTAGFAAVLGMLESGILRIFRRWVGSIKLSCDMLAALQLWSPTLATVSFAINHTDHLAILAIKSSIIHDPQNVLDSWNTSFHFCQWQGVTCGRRHRRVTRLDLNLEALLRRDTSFLWKLHFSQNFIGPMYNLQLISFGFNHLYGTIPQFLLNLTSLKVLSIPNNSISGSLPKDIGLELPNLKILYIWGNKFTGSIPFSFFNCSNLLELELSDNRFTGKINIDLRRMPNLQVVGLGPNSLGSSEPDEMNFIDSMVNCSKLEIIYLGTNQLTGVLPNSIGNLSSQLIALSFSRNFIYGTLPSGIGNLVKLERLLIDSN